MFVPARRFLMAVTVLATVLLQVLASPAGAAVPEPGPGRALWGGNLPLQAREPSLSRPLDIVRGYSQWSGAGPPQVDTARLQPLMTGGRRTLLVSSGIPWDSWRNEARTRNSDADT